MIDKYSRHRKMFHLEIYVFIQKTFDRYKFSKVFFELFDFNSGIEFNPNVNPAVVEFARPEKMILHVTYERKRKMRLPPPYDTKCQVYSGKTKFPYYHFDPKQEATSQSDCINECLKSRSKVKGFLTDKIIIEELEFGKRSDLRFIRGPEVNVEEKGVKNWTRKQFPDYFLKDDAPPNFLDQLVPLVNDSLKILKSCKKLCPLQDCRRNEMTMKLIDIKRQGSLEDDDAQRRSLLEVFMYPPPLSVVTLESKAKITFYDLLIQFMGNLSFFYCLYLILMGVIEREYN